MSLVIPPGYANLVYRFGLDGDAEEMIFTLGVDMGDFDGGNAAADAAYADFVLSWTAAGILQAWHFLGVRAYVGQDGAPPTVHDSVGAVVDGTNGGPGLPPNCAFLVQKRTGLGGRRGRGRMFLPAGVGVGEDSVPVTGVMNEPQRAGLNDRATGAFSGLAPVLLHDSETPGSLVPTPITAFVVAARLATVRRRLRP